MKTIRLKATDVESIDKAIEELETLAKKLKTAEMEIARQLAEIGLQMVEFKFATAEPTEYWDAYIRESGNGYVIEAIGDAVIFIEFGAGASTEDYPHPNAEGLPPIYKGSYSETEGSGQYIEKGYWYYRKHKYFGYPEDEPPAHGFYEAEKAIQERAEEIVRKVLRKL